MSESTLSRWRMPGIARRADRWRDEALRWRDRLLASGTFQRRVARIPLLRGIAERRAAALFDLTAGFVYSQVLYACVELRLFALLAEAPATAETLASRLGLPEAGARRLLDAAVSLRLLEQRHGGRYGLGPLGAPLADDGAIAALVRHHRVLYQDLADPLPLLRGERGGGALARYWAYDAAADATADRVGPVADYSALMASSQPLVNALVLDAHRFARHRRLLDIGGGEGGFAIAAARRHPSLQCTVVDLPAVVARATRRIRDAGLADRVAARACDILREPLPTGADVACLLRVVHDHDDPQALQILVAAGRALAPGGTLLLAEPMAGTPGCEAMGDAYFGFYLLAMGRGRPRTAGALTALLARAGFVDIRPVRTALPLQCRLLVARRGDKTPVAID